MSANSDKNTRSTGEIQEIVMSLVDNLDAMLAYWDINQVCVFANDAYRDWFGKSGQDVIGMKLEQLLGPLYRQNLPYIQAAYQGKVQVFERDIPTPDGRIRHSLATYTPHVVEGSVRGIFVHVADVSTLKALEKELRMAKLEAEKQATHDFLTGLPNRVLLGDRIQQALAYAKRSGKLVAGLTLDLDNFKRVNDTYGHAGGDHLLIEIARRLQHSLRANDSVIRMGGDEFFLLFPEIDSVEQAQAMACRVLENVNRPLQIGSAIIEPACSVGIAFNTATSTPESLVDESDRALYLAKNRGKNRYAMATATELLPPPD